MDPAQYEEMVCNYFRSKGYKTEITPYCGDYGVDVIAAKGKERIAVQAKMYGGGSRKINRQMVMELHGAKDYFDCTKAVIATDGVLLQDASEVAKKLNIDILRIDGYSETSQSKIDKRSFGYIWEKCIMPLQGKTLTRDGGRTNKILTVDWGGIERITSNGRKGYIKIEIFRYAVNKLIKEGYISRDEINQNYVGRASSGVVLILSQVPFFIATKSPSGLKYSEHGM